MLSCFIINQKGTGMNTLSILKNLAAVFTLMASVAQADPFSECYDKAYQTKSNLDSVRICVAAKADEIKYYSSGC